MSEVILTNEWTVSGRVWSCRLTTGETWPSLSSDKI